MADVGEERWKADDGAERAQLKVARVASGTPASAAYCDEAYAMTRKGEAELRASGAVGAGDDVKILTSCPSCLQGLSRYQDDLRSGLLEADYVVVEMARHILGEDWMARYVGQANAGGIERVLV